MEETKGRRKGGGGGEERGGVSDAISNTFLLTNILHLQGPQHSQKATLPHSHQGHSTFPKGHSTFPKGHITLRKATDHNFPYIRATESYKWP